MNNISTSAGTVEAALLPILQDYRSLIAELVQDRHNHGITTDELVAVDNKVLAAITAAMKQREAKAGLIRAISEIESLRKINGILRVEPSTGQLVELLNKLKVELAELQPEKEA